MKKESIIGLVNRLLCGANVINLITWHTLAYHVVVLLKSKYFTLEKRLLSAQSPRKQTRTNRGMLQGGRFVSKIKIFLPDTIVVPGEKLLY